MNFSLSTTTKQNARWRLILARSGIVKWSSSLNIISPDKSGGFSKKKFVKTYLFKKVRLASVAAISLLQRRNQKEIRERAIITWRGGGGGLGNQSGDIGENHN